MENLKFFEISDDEMNFTVKFVSRNLITQLNFVEIRDTRNFTFFETEYFTFFEASSVECLSK